MRLFDRHPECGGAEGGRHQGAVVVEGVTSTYVATAHRRREAVRVRVLDAAPV